MRKRTTLYDEGDLFSIAPNLGRGCHFFIYDSEVEWQGPAIAKTVNALYHPEEKVPSGHCFNPFEENNGNGDRVLVR